MNKLFKVTIPQKFNFLKIGSLVLFNSILLTQFAQSVKAVKPVPYGQAIILYSKLEETARNANKTFPEVNPDTGHADIMVYYEQNGEGDDPRRVYVYNYPMAVSSSGIIGLFKNLFKEFSGDNLEKKQKAINEKNASSIKNAFSGVFSILMGIANKCGISPTVAAKVLPSTLAKLTSNPAVVRVLRVIGPAGIIIGGVLIVGASLYGLDKVADERQLARDEGNVESLFDKILSFLEYKEWKSGNVIVLAIDQRKLWFFNILQENLGVWAGVENYPNLPNAVTGNFYNKYFENTREELKELKSSLKMLKEPTPPHSNNNHAENEVKESGCIIL